MSVETLTFGCRLNAYESEVVKAEAEKAGLKAALIVNTCAVTEEAVRQAVAQEEALRAQNAVLAELSTPLIPISDDVMVMPLIGAVDSRRAQQVMHALLEGTASRNARTVILDITGVPVVDTQVANALIGAARALRLLGAQVVLTGIRPEVAQTMVGLGVDLGSVTTRSSLQSGIAFAISQS